jgi:hypothetical protein
MGISPGKSKSKAALAALGQPAFFKSLHRRILYRRWFPVVMLACVICLPCAVAAQEERPQITPGERKVPRKKDAGPRALALLQLTANGKASLLPIAILINGKFYDATAYKADPIPMALDSGNVYEAERTGTSLGLFTVNSALHSNALNAPSPWLGTGNWAPAGAEVASKNLKAETAPVGIDNSDGPPRLTRNKEAVKAAPPASSTPPASTAPAKGGSDGDEPPRLSRGSEPASPPAGTSPTPTNSAPAAGTPDAKPGDSKASDAKPEAPKPPESDSGASDANRPRLRRGKPVESLPDEDFPGYSKPGATVSGGVSPAKAADTSAKGPVQLIPAISDASGPDPRSYTFSWLKDEEGERRKQMLALAKVQLRAYLDARAKANITPKPAHAASHSPARKPPEPIVENVQMIAYDLWNNNEPVLVFAADAHLPPPPVGTPHAAADSELQYSIMMVARTDIYNNLHKLYVGVTDRYHLDMTPRLELIDAVDADGDGRGELLFRETSDAGSGWLIYRATADRLWKLFDSLNPE